MAVKRYGVQNPSANTETTLLTTNDPLLISVIATNKHASADADIRVFVIPNGATNSSQYAYIAYDLQLNPGNSVETHRFAVNAGDTVKVSSSISDVSFSAAGIPQTDILPADETQVFTNKTISGLNNTLTNIGNSSLTNSQITLMGEQMDLGETVANLDYFQFDTASNPASAVGRMTWDDGEGTVSLGIKGGNINLQLGQENIALCYNGTESTITKGSVVYISGAQGQRPSITLSDADTEATSSKTFGVAAENISNGAEGFVCTFGVVTGVDTSSFTAGQALWLSSTAGQLTNVVPTQPAHAVFVGYCLSVNATSGRIFVNPQNGYELQELHNVLINGIADNHILSYDNATSLWKNQGLAAAIQEVDGASSGIDADLLDGQHAAAFGLVSGKLSQFAATTSAELAGVISDETGSGSLVFSTSPTISYPIMVSPEERFNIVASAATGVINFDLLTSTVWYYTSNATADHTLNFRGNSGTTLNSMLTVGDSISAIWLNTNGTTAYRPTVFQIDGSAVTPRWSGGTAPASGNASSIDAYSFTIVKTAATPTYVVLAGQTRFA